MGRAWSSSRAGARITREGDLDALAIPWKPRSPGPAPPISAQWRLILTVDPAGHVDYTDATDGVLSRTRHGFTGL